MFLDTKLLAALAHMDQRLLLIAIVLGGLFLWAMAKSISDTREDRQLYHESSEDYWDRQIAIQRGEVNLEFSFLLVLLLGGGVALLVAVVLYPQLLTMPIH